jgi:hypothetical protein
MHQRGKPPFPTCEFPYVEHYLGRSNFSQLVRVEKSPFPLDAWEHFLCNLCLTSLKFKREA